MKKALLAAVFAAFFSYSGSASNQGRTCGTMDVLNAQIAKDPSLSQKMQDIENHTSAYVVQQASKNGNRTNMVITIPVVFHVVYSSSSQNVSDALILAQLDQLNLDFAKLNPDASLIPSIFSGVAANTGIQFCMAQRTPSGSATNGIERRQTTVSSFSTNNAVKSFSSGGLDAWNSSQYLNIWVCNLSGGVLGYAQFPGGSSTTDGIVLTYYSVGSVANPNPAGAPYNLGRTATHEVGHWLNLRHIWGDANCGSDLVSDTPTHNTSNSGCPAYPHYSTCTGTPIEMTMNYMDYTEDRCMYMFSAGQSARMNALFATGGTRASILSSPGCTPPNTCGTPSGLTVTNLSSSGSTISWNASSNAASYTVQYCVSGTTNCVSTTTTGTSVALNGLSPATAYTYSITATCSTGTSSAVSGSFTTFSAACGDPTNLVATPSATTAGVTLTWTGIAGASGYTVQYKTTTSTNWTSTTTSGTSLTLNLASSTTYNWQVRANCIGISGNFVAGADFTTGVATCGSPGGLSVSSISSTGATLSWGAVSGASSYNLQYKTSTATTWTTISNTTTSRALTGLTAATTYNWQVSAVCSNGASSPYVAGSNFTTSSTPTCSDVYEANETRSAARTISTNTDIIARIATSSDRDWFRFSTTSPNTNIRITLTNLPKDYDIRLYNSSGSTLTTSANGGTTSETITRNTTSAATYFIQVYPYTSTDFSSTLCYTLRVNVGSSAFRIGEDGSLADASNEIELNDFVLYPNPAQNMVNVNYHALESGTASIRFFDLLGKVIIDQQLNVDGGYNKFSFNVSEFNKGIYFVELIRNGERTIKKVVIEH